ncbi:MAG TPA: hypothetical protein VJN67_00875 [Stellaceae bacterium]|nr:hypothetical protein [Stellaceae bacterium]
MRDSGRDTEARRKAEAVLAQRKKQDDAIVQQRAREREAAAEKVARLRELRLAKEAAEAQAKPKARFVASRRKSGTQAS